MMKLELIKQTEASGKVWFIVRTDGNHAGAFYEEKDAFHLFTTLREKNIKPGEEILLTEEIPDK